MLQLQRFFLFLFFIPAALFAQHIRPDIDISAAEPVKYVGSDQPDKHFFDGRLPHAVGVHHYQAFRANRTDPPEGGLLGWTYNHAPMLCYWNDRFYVQYLSNPKEEHHAPGRTLLMSSLDGRRWSDPQVIFPIIYLPETTWREYHIPEGTPSVMHQRMGFYLAPSDRLLTIGFYSYCPNPRIGPNLGQGVGRVVREIRQDGSFGPIYFIRYNRPAGWDENNTPWFPFYKSSDDAGFVQACDSLLANKLITLQWWEMEQSNYDNFYTLDPGQEETKALCFYHRPDGVVVALWKHQLSALSPDNGRTWTPLARSKSLWTCGAKVWGQRTEDGRYALVYNHSATRRNRFPLVVITGNDGHSFGNMLCVHGEVPPMRYQGIHKNSGPQYIRGIVEGNGDPPGNHLWITYSMDKEDIWVTRVRVPINGTVDKHISQNFENVDNESELELWNFHIPKWAPISVVADPENFENHCIELRDEEPYDYALAERAFPESRQLNIKFRVKQQRAGQGLLIFEVQDSYCNRPLRLRFDPEWLSVDHLKVETHPIAITMGKWYDIALKLSCDSQSYDLAINGKWVKTNVPFAMKTDSLERLVFRTGPWRGEVPPRILNGEAGNPGLDLEDLPGADHKSALSVFLIDDVRTE